MRIIIKKFFISKNIFVLEKNNFLFLTWHKNGKSSSTLTTYAYTILYLIKYGQSVKYFLCLHCLTRTSHVLHDITVYSSCYYDVMFGLTWACKTRIQWYQWSLFSRLCSFFSFSLFCDQPTSFERPVEFNLDKGHPPFHSSAHAYLLLKLVK